MFLISLIFGCFWLKLGIIVFGGYIFFFIEIWYFIFMRMFENCKVFFKIFELIVL